MRAAGPNWNCVSSDPGLTRTSRLEKIQDALGAGSKIVVECVDRRRRFTLGTEISLYDERSSLLLECWFKNASSSPLVLRTLEPLRALPEEEGICEWNYLDKALRNGFIYYDPGNLEDFSSSKHYRHTSIWNMGFAGGDQNPGLTVGFIENDTAIGKLEAGAEAFRDRAGMSLIAEATFEEEFVVPVGKTVRSGRFALQIGTDPFSALESYAQMIGEAHKVRFRPMINGWCPWFYGHQTITEDEVLKNADFAARHLKPHGLEFIQIDDGYQRSFGDWEGNAQFPHGMRWLAQQIRARGLRPGLWFAPYVISDGSDIHKNHPDWLIRNLNGGIRHCGDRGSTKLYGLDITVPAAQEWFRTLCKTMVKDWGYEFIKLDFVEWTILAAERYADPSWNCAMAYRRGAEIIREALGPEGFFLDCGPAQVSAGLIDSTRIEADQPFLTWHQYAGQFNSNAPAMAKRYFFHKRAWINDADHLGLALLSPSQAMAAASIIALSGGTMISGDRLTELDELRLGILQKVFPSYGEAARPIDLFERDRPEIFSLVVKRPFEEWMVVGLFNYDENTAAEKTVSLERLGLDSRQNWLAFEFWNQRLIGRVRDQLQVFLPPASVALIALRKDRGVPQVISTSRHFSQGGVELKGVAWNDAKTTLSGISLGGDGTQHNVVVYVPKDYALDLDEPELPHDFSGYSVMTLPDGPVRVHVSFAGKTEVPWTLRFKRSVAT